MTAVNTIHSTPYEVPNSNGAKRVFLSYAEIETYSPESVAATETSVHSALFIGKKTASTCDLDQEGCVTNVKSFKYCTAGPVPTLVWIAGPEAPPMLPPGVEITKHTDGKFYITISTNTVGHSIVRGSRAHLRFFVVP